MKLTMNLMLSVSLGALLLSGCNTMVRRFAQPQLIAHRVMPGETLGCIAKWYSGKESQWQQIAGYNPGINPKNLQVNDIVKVPTAIATTHNQQARFSLASRCTPVPQPARPSPRPLPTPTEVFGPK